MIEVQLQNSDEEGSRERARANMRKLEEMDLGLADRWVLITGAAGGIGSACARVIAGAGGRVILTDLPSASLDAVEAELSAAGAAAVAIPSDLRNGDAARQVLTRARSAGGAVYGMVGAAGIIETAPFLDMSSESWERVLDINLDANMRLLQAWGAGLEGNEGAAVLISSTGAHIGRPNGAHYGASKAALISLGMSAAVALAPRARVNVVCPGPVRTKLWNDMLAERSRMFGAEAATAFERDRERDTPLGRLATPDDVARVVLFLLSDLACFVTGQALDVDGGLHAS